jgi:hypothetical protein
MICQGACDLGTHSAIDLRILLLTIGAVGAHSSPESEYDDEFDDVDDAIKNFAIARNVRNDECGAMCVVQDRWK